MLLGRILIELLLRQNLDALWHLDIIGDWRLFQGPVPQLLRSLAIQDVLECQLICLVFLQPVGQFQLVLLLVL